MYNEEPKLGWAFLFTKKTLSYGYQNLIINLRRSSDRLRFIMGILIPIRQWLPSEQGLSDLPRQHCDSSWLGAKWHRAISCHKIIYNEYFQHHRRYHYQHASPWHRWTSCLFKTCWSHFVMPEFTKENPNIFNNDFLSSKETISSSLLWY